MSDFTLIFVVMIAGFSLGQLLFGWRPESSAHWRSLAVALALRITVPISILLAMWNLQQLHWALAWLPLIGAAIMLAGFFLGLGLSRPLGMSPADRAVYGPSGGFVNLGALGSLTLFVYLGEPGLALLPLYKLFEELIYFGLLFPYARRHGIGQADTPAAVWKDPVLLSVVGCWLCGMVLNLAGISRPLWMGSVTSILVPASSFLLMISVGLVFRFRALLPELGRALPISLLRVVLLPALGLGMVWLLGLQQVNGGLIAATVLILASMPAAVLTIVPAALFGLNQGLANACWLVSNLAFLAWLPLVPLLLDLIQP
ncbi:AEC family transporter [Aestuariirhabdus sp. LZHN29]|uniref:AEC family transporter n=1 Tax=Aestuariirhabdus sp. LZHN29 TaxID=3417462 RepID=UPI003CEBA634